MKGFWNDSDGFNKGDFEKLVTGLLFIVTTIALVIRFLQDKPTDLVFVQFALGIGALFVVRKGLSYFKPEQYYTANSSSAPTIPVTVEGATPVDNSDSATPTGY